MKIHRTKIPDVLEIVPDVHGDSRGYFLETFRDSWLVERGIGLRFIQDNESLSRRGVLRGLHFQKTKPQGKLVRVIQGEVFDVAVDIRRGSPSFGRWVGRTLSGERKNQLWIPPGFAHGFLVLSDTCVFAYKCTEYYDASDDRGILWNDPAIGIEWPMQESGLILSDKDRGLPLLKDADRR